MVSTQPAPSAPQNGTPRRSIVGIARNIGSEGRTNQKVASAWAARRWTSWVSRQSHIMPRMETSGSEATSAPKPGLRRAISETAAMITPDSAALITR
jgi:hypothetical protein